MLKKMMLFATTAAAIAAFAVPASASAADVWTDDHVELGEGETAAQPFEGFLQFSAAPFGTFGCEVTVVVEAEGPVSGTVTEFSPTTETCVGTGIFYDKCKLAGHSTNINDGWEIDVSTTPATVTRPGGNVTIRTAYASCPSGATGSHLEFASIAVTPTLNAEGTIVSLSIAGTATNGAIASGTVYPEIAPTLGLTAT